MKKQTWADPIGAIIICLLIMTLLSLTGLESGFADENPKAFYLKIGDNVIINEDDVNEIPESITSQQAGMAPELFTLTKNTDGMTLTLEGSPMPEELDEDTPFDELDIKTIGPITIRGFNAMANLNEGKFTITQNNQRATMIRGGDTGRKYGENSDPKSALTAIDADGNLEITGEDKSAIVLFGGIYCGGAENKDISGNLNITGANLTIMGMPLASSGNNDTKPDGGNMVAVFGSENQTGLKSNDGLFTISGGTLTAIGLGDDWDALQVEGDMNVDNGGFHQILSIFGNGGTISGVLREGEKGQFLVGSTLGRGPVVQNVKGKDLAVDLHGIQSVFLGVIDLDQNDSSSPSLNEPVCGLLVNRGGVSISGSGTHMAVSAGINDEDAGLKLEGKESLSNAKLKVADSATLMAISAMGHSGAIVLPDSNSDTDNLIIEDNSTVTAIGVNKAITANGISISGSTLNERGSLNAYACELLNVDGFVSIDNIKNQANKLKAKEAVFLTKSHSPININPEISSILKGDNSDSGSTSADKTAIYTYGSITIDGGSLCAMAYGSDESDSTVAVDAAGINLKGNTPIMTALAEGGKVSGVNGIRIRKDTYGSQKLEIVSGSIFTAYGKLGKSVLLDNNTSMVLNASTSSANVAYGDSPSDGLSEILSKSVSTIEEYGKWVNAPYFYCVPEDASTHIDDKNYITWDHMDKGTTAFVTPFDPPTGNNRVSKEMMRILQGMRTSTVMICSDNTDFSKNGFMASYADAYSQSSALDPENPNAPIYTSLIIKGTEKATERSRGTAYMFKTGFLYKDGATGSMARMQLTDDTGDYYDFGSRIDTAPEYKQIKKLTDKNIIHSIHFNYPQNSNETMDLPVETQLLVLLGENYKETETDWVFMNKEATQLEKIGSYNVDPFGGLSLDINKVNKNTAFLTDIKPNPTPDRRDNTATEVDTGDVGMPWLAMILLIFSALVIMAISLNSLRKYYSK